MQFRQKRFSCRTSFDFSEDELVYSFDNGLVRTGGNIPYHKIPFPYTRREVKIWWFVYAIAAILAFCGVGVSHYLSVNDTEMVLHTLYFAVLAFFCAGLKALVSYRGTLSSIALDPPLVILHDGQRDAILGEMKKRRKEEMRRKLAHLDFSKPYYEELQKFKWLREQSVIDEQEYQGVRQKIAAVRDKGGQAAPPPDQMN